MKQENINKIQEYLENMNSDELVTIWNEYINDLCYYDDEIFRMDEFDINNEGRFSSPMELLNHVNMGEFNTYDDYYKEDIYGFESINLNNLHSHIEFGDLAEWLVDNAYKVYWLNSDICDLVDELEESEEE